MVRNRVTQTHSLNFDNLKYHLSFHSAKTFFLELEDIKTAIRSTIEHFAQKDIDKSLGVFPAFSDFKITVDQQLVEGNRIFSAWRISGVHTGEFQGIPPTGRAISLSGIAVHSIEKTKIV